MSGDHSTHVLILLGASRSMRASSCGSLPWPTTFAGCVRGLHGRVHGSLPNVSGRSGEVVAVLGCEMSLFCSGFVPGEGLSGLIGDDDRPRDVGHRRSPWPRDDGRVRSRAGRAAVDRWKSARDAFGGRIMYAAGTWENIEWDLFDIVSVDAYRDAGNAADYRDQVPGIRQGPGRPW